MSPNPGPKCSAHSSQTGLPCTQSPMRGQTVCATHGGKSPNALAGAARRADLERAQQEVRTYGLRLDIGPHEALTEEVQWTAGHVRYCRDMVARFGPDELVWGKTGTTQRSTGVGSDGRPLPDFAEVKSGAGPITWLQLYQQERTHLISACKAAIAGGVAERQVRLNEQIGTQIGEFISAFVGDAELAIPPDLAARVARKHMLRLHPPEAA